MFSALLSQAALTFGKGQDIFVMSLGNHCCVTAVFPIEMVSRPGEALERMMPAIGFILRPFLLACRGVRGGS